MLKTMRLLCSLDDIYTAQHDQRNICLPKGRHSEAAHEKRLLCARKMYQGWGGVGHVGVGWGWIMQGVWWGHVGVGWVGWGGGGVG